MKSVRTAVLIHGCHLQASLNGKTWEEIVFGPGGSASLEGRATFGIKTAIDHAAELVIFSTGGSEREGIKEGEFTHRTAILRAAEIGAATGYYEKAVLDLLRERSEIEIESVDTRTECEINFARCASAGFGRIVIVSSPWHIQRCHTEALNVAEAMRARGETVPEIIALASHGSTEGVVVLEPPHRGDRPKTRFHELGRRLFKVPPQNIVGFEAGWDELLEKQGA